MKTNHPDRENEAYIGEPDDEPNDSSASRLEARIAELERLLAKMQDQDTSLRWRLENERVGLIIELGRRACRERRGSRDGKQD